MCYGFFLFREGVIIYRRMKIIPFNVFMNVILKAKCYEKDNYSNLILVENTFVNITST